MQWIENDSPGKPDSPDSLSIDKTYTTNFPAGRQILVIGPTGITKKANDAGQFVNTHRINFLEPEGGNQEWYVRIEVDDDGWKTYYGTSALNDIILNQKGSDPSIFNSPDNSSSSGGGGCFIYTLLGQKGLMP